jgi:hypothetical protein
VTRGPCPSSISRKGGCLTRYSEFVSPRLIRCERERQPEINEAGERDLDALFVEVGSDRLSASGGLREE